jgi:hypothetical protein
VTHRLPFSRFEEGVRLARERKALKVVFAGERTDGNSLAMPAGP